MSTSAPKRGSRQLLTRADRIPVAPRQQLRATDSHCSPGHVVMTTVPANISVSAKPFSRACTSTDCADNVRKYFVGQGVVSSTSVVAAFGGDSVRRLAAAPDSSALASAPSSVPAPVGRAVAPDAFIVSCCGVMSCAAAVAVAVADSDAAASRASWSSRIIAACPNSKTLRIISSGIVLPIT